MASIGGNCKVVKLLINAGANVNGQDEVYMHADIIFDIYAIDLVL